MRPRFYAVTTVSATKERPAAVLQIGADLEGGLEHLAGDGEEAGDVTSL